MAAPKVLDLSTEKFIKDMTEINPKYDDSVIIKAYEIARSLHDGQFRKSGEPYIIHPVAVAKILAQFGMDNETVIAGLLHDVVEDTRYTREQLAEDFDEKIADLVEGVTKLTNISYDSSEAAQVENFRKMFLAMSKDICRPRSVKQRRWRPWKYTHLWLADSEYSASNSNLKILR